MRTLAASLLALSLAVSAPAQAKDYDPILPDQAAVVAGQEWLIEVSAPQDTIATSIDVGRVVADSGGGLLGSLIIAAQDNKREVLSENAQMRADATARPLRSALEGFDVEALAQETTAKVFGPGSTDPDALTNMGANEGARTGIVMYRYGLSPDFTQIRVTADVELGAATKPWLRQRVTSIVELRRRSYEPSENAAQWAAGEARLAKSALEAGFARLATLIPAALKIDKAQFADLTSKKQPKAFAAGFYGPELFRDETGPAIWTDEGAVAVVAM